ncbi:hypothetical protein FACS189451_11360 [Bacteroidia bacterium]|nr:hypothetical protein FACS189446_5250 [Bacteroidia bacterium]GHT64038.1 hypothetical protein FACS189451_11360 [Bacteroidia bacterium]
MKKIITILFGVAILGFTSCEEWLDINNEPNSPSEKDLTPSLIFAGTELDLANNYGNFFRILGGYYAQHYAQSFGTSNYLDYSQFKTSSVRTNRPYEQMNTLTLNNLKSVRNLASASEDWGSYLAATVLRAVTFQILVDAYGETPYTEALDISIPAPKYDDGQTVYNGILAELDEALSKASPSNTVCTNFLFGSGSTAAEWIKFANALKLKILMRMSNTADVQSKLAALISENNFPAGDVAWKDIWSNDPGKANPFYQEEFASYFGSTQVNVVANIALMSTMQASNDARIPYFFDKNSDGNYTGAVSGSNFSTSSYAAAYWCRPAVKYNSPVFLITRSEIEFFLSEYSARYGSAADAEAHYKAAIEASFATCGVSGADVIYNIYYKYNQADYQRIIGTQKWIALAGINNFEAWCEMRRLKYPTFGTVSGDDLYNEATKVYSPDKYIVGTLYTPVQVNTSLGANLVLQRFMYAESSKSRNSNAPTYPGDKTPVFWAK